MRSLALFLIFLPLLTAGQATEDEDNILLGDEMVWSNSITRYSGIFGFYDTSYYALRFETLPILERYDKLIASNSSTVDSCGTLSILL